MIEFKIVTCPDKSQQATYQHIGTELTIGKTEGDMIVDDPALSAVQLRIKLHGDKAATLENLNPMVELRLNGRPVNGIVPLKEKDSLTISRTTISFSRLDTSLLQAPEPFRHPSASERFTPGSKELAIQDALKYLEDHTSNPGSPPVPAAALFSGAASPRPPLPPGAPGVKPPLPPGKGGSPPPLPGTGTNMSPRTGTNMLPGTGTNMLPGTGTNIPPKKS